MKFNLIYEEVLKRAIDIKNFKYRFIYDDTDDKLQCKYESIDKNTNELIFITATINKNDITFDVFSKDKEKIKSYTDKEFLMAYYKEYQNFKQAYKIYKKDPNFFEHQKKEEQTNTDEVKIKSLDEILQQDKNQDAGYSIKYKNTYFTFKQLQENTLHNVITCEFLLKNNATFKANSSLPQYNALATIKIFQINSKILKVELYEPSKEASEPVESLSNVEFKTNFKDEYYALQAALAIFQNHYQKQQNDGI